MKPLYGVHPGEYLFGCQIERRYPKLKLWMPTKDVGEDFLITNEKHTKSVSIQVKYSKDFNWTHGKDIIKPFTKSAGWYSLNPHKLKKSTADYWVLVNYDGVMRGADFIIIKPSILFGILSELRGYSESKKTFESYIHFTKDGRAFETRDLNTKDLNSINKNTFLHTLRTLTTHLERWDLIEKHFEQ